MPRFIPHSKTDSQRARIDAAITSNFLFRNLDDDLKQHVVNIMAEKHIPNGTTVVHQGGEGDFFYIVEDGTFDCYIQQNIGDDWRHSDTTTTAGRAASRVVRYGPGGSFGELALMYNAPRAATVVATSDATVWALDRITFRSLLLENMAHKRQIHHEFLANVSIFRSLNAHERHKIADSLECVQFNDNDVVMREGDRGRSFYLIEDGVALCYKKSADGAQIQVNRLSKGNYFGELALLNDDPRAATVVANGPLKCVTLDKDAFNRLLGSVMDILQRNSAGYHASLHSFDE